MLVANPRKTRLIYGDKHKTDKLDAENLARLARVDPKLLHPLKHRGARVRRRTWLSCALGRPSRRHPHATDQPPPRSGQILWGTLAQVFDS